MKTLLFILTTVLVQTNSWAGVEQNILIKFDKPEKFVDFKSDYMRTDKDQKRLMVKLTKLLTESIQENIPANQSIEITITEIDMAGRYIFNPQRMIRVVKDSDRTKIAFSYKLLDEQGNVLNTAEVAIKEFGSRANLFNRTKYKHSLFSNEMIIFDKWLAKQKFMKL